MAKMTQPGGPDTAELVSLGRGAYAHVQAPGTWWINNAGFIAGSRGVVCIDTCATRRRTEDYLRQVRLVTNQPVRILVNTHHHGDHTFGNALLPEATVVAHERTREELLAMGPPQPMPFWTEVDWGGLELNPPVLTYADRVTVWVDDLPLEVRHVGLPAHTTNDSIVWIAEHGLLFAGDLLFNGVTPFFLQGSLIGAVQVLEEVIRPLGAQVIVPGHGEVCGPKCIDEILGYLRFVLDAAASARQAGLTPLAAAREIDLGRYAEWLDPERIVGNLHRAYSDLDGGDLGRSLDIIAVMSDMVEFNGGAPLPCSA
jgi:cyclase